MSEEVKNGERTEQNTPDWPRIRAEYITGNESLPEIAARFGVPESTVRKHSTKGRWSEARKKKEQEIAERVSAEVTDRQVKATARRVEKCYTEADKLLKKISRAIREVDKVAYIAESEETKQIETTEDEDGCETVKKRTERKLKAGAYKTLIDTGKVSNIAKSLLQLTQILGGAEEKGSDGDAQIIEIPQMIELVPPDEENGEVQNGGG